MHKIWIIIQREYTSRVKNKRFLIVTFLVPLLMVGLIVGSAYFSFKGIFFFKLIIIFKIHLMPHINYTFNRY